MQKVPIIHKEMKGMVHSIPAPLNENDRLNLHKEILLESQKIFEKLNTTKYHY